MDLTFTLKTAQTDTHRPWPLPQIPRSGAVANPARDDAGSARVLIHSVRATMAH